jgi:F0F1-type ATP synthase membrane subunit c/vacuolar-type H+-ATPase subunit K
MATNSDWELTEDEEKEVTKRSLIIAAIPATIWLLALLVYPFFRS